MGSARSAVPFLLVGVSGTGQRRSELRWQIQIRWQVQILALLLTSSMTLAKPFASLNSVFFYQVESTLVSEED